MGGILEVLSMAYSWLSALTTIWFTIGGLQDLKKMFSLLKTIKRNDLDDGTVIDDHNLNEDVSE